LIFDPLIKVHGCNENSNTAMDLVAEILTDLAVRHNMAVDVPHHIRKGLPEPRNADAGRGASALKDGGRLIYTQTVMSKDEAQLYSLSEDERLSLVRVDQGKVNLARRTGQVQWYKLTGVKLGNTKVSPLYPHGDEVQTIEAWDAPDPQKLEKTQIAEIFTELRKGPCRGEHYSPETNSNDWAGILIKTVAGKSEPAAALILKTWTDNEVLVKDRYPSPVHNGRRIWGLTLNETKAREILGRLYQPPKANQSEDLSEPADKAAQKDKPTDGVKLTPVETILMQQLGPAMAASPEGVSYTQWRDQAVSAGISKKAFIRIVNQLAAKKVVERHENGMLVKYGCANYSCAFAGAQLNGD